MLDPDDRSPGPRDVLDAAGRVVARLDIADRVDWMQADVTWWSADLTAGALGAILAADLGGLRVASTDEPLVAALVRAGGTVARRGTQLEYDATAAPPPREWLDRTERDGVRLVDYRPVDAEIAAGWFSAYPPDHPDHNPALTGVEDAINDLRRTQRGAVTGSFSDASALAADHADAVLGGIMVTLMRPNPHWAGPWVPDVFTRPEARGRGIGERLVRYAVAAVAAAGERGLALSVSDGNPARRLYERVGFRPTITFASVAMPRTSA